MALTTWLLMFGGLAFVAIVVDGLRRMFANHAALKIDIDESLCGLPEEVYTSELPNGGARVVAVESISDPAEDQTLSGLEFSVDALPTNRQQDSLIDEDVVAKGLSSEYRPVEGLVVNNAATEELMVEPLMVADSFADESALKELALQPLTTVAIVEVDIAVEDEVEIEVLTELTIETADIVSNVTVAVDVIEESTDQVSGREKFTLDRTPVSLSSEEIDALTTNSGVQDIAADVLNAAAPCLDFDPTRPVHELVETDSMVQSDLFAEQDLTSLATVKSSVGHELLETSDDILFSDTGIEELYPDDLSSPDADVLSPSSQDKSLATRLAKVTSMTFGKKLLSRKRVVEQEAMALAVEEEKSKQVVSVEQVISILVTANDSQGFYGPQLLQLVEACGMVHGEMGIFHRFEDGLRLGKTQFSMANMMEPGTFDLTTIDHMHTPGVVFFLGLPMAQDSMQAFDFMLETAQCLASNLGGGVLDEQRSVMRPQTIAHCRQQIREFERRNMTRRAQL